jgi:hypothetical protein
MNNFVESFRKYDLASLLIIAYVASLSLINLPLFGKISLSELIFPFLVVTIFLQFKSCLNPQNIFSSDLFVGLFGLLTLFSTIIYPNSHTIFNLVSFVYLVLLGLTFRMYTIGVSVRVVEVLVVGFSLCGVILFLTGAIGWIMALQFKQHNLWAWYYLDFPYLGNVPRARGWVGTPEMMASILSASLLLKLFVLRSESLNVQLLKLVAALEIIGLFLCLSKTIILLLGVCILIFSLQQKPARKFVGVFVGSLLCLLYLVGTHFIWIRSDEVMSPLSSKIAITNLGAVCQNHHIFTSPYYELKRAALLAGEESGIFYLKGASFNAWLDHLKLENKFPNHIESYDPHCTYLGAYAELGWLGLLSVTGWLLTPIIVHLYRLKRRGSKEFNLILGINLFFILLAINTDLLHFRHWWILSFGFIPFLNRNSDSFN